MRTAALGFLQGLFQGRACLEPFSLSIARDTQRVPIIGLLRMERQGLLRQFNRDSRIAKCLVGRSIGIQEQVFIVSAPITSLAVSRTTERRRYCSRPRAAGRAICRTVPSVALLNQSR